MFGALRGGLICFASYRGGVCGIMRAVGLITGLASLLFSKSVEAPKNGPFLLRLIGELGACIGFREVEVHFRAPGGEPAGGFEFANGCFILSQVEGSASPKV